MANKGFGAKSISLIGVGTPSVVSPNTLNLDASTVAISTNLTVGNNITVGGNLIGNVTGNVTGTSGGLSGTPNITVGLVTASQGYNLGVSSNSNTITTGPVKSLNFTGIGIGTVSVNGTTVDIEIPGGIGTDASINTTGIITAAAFDSSVVGGTPYIGVGVGKTQLNIDAENVAISSNFTVLGAFNSNNASFSGIVTAGSFIGDGSGLIGLAGIGSGIQVEYQNSLVGTASTINFGDGLIVSPISVGVVTVSSSTLGIDTLGVTNFNHVNVGGALTAGSFETESIGGASTISVSGLSTEIHIKASNVAISTNLTVGNNVTVSGNLNVSGAISGSNFGGTIAPDGINMLQQKYTRFFKDLTTSSSSINSEIYGTSFGTTIWREPTSGSGTGVRVGTKELTIEPQSLYGYMAKFTAGGPVWLSWGGHPDGSGYRQKLATNGIGVSVLYDYQTLGQLDANTVSLAGTAYFGANNDLEILHNGSHSRIADRGTGNLQILTNSNIVLLHQDNVNDPGETLAKFKSDGSCELYYDNSLKLETAGAGVTVTGAVYATSFVGDGSGLTGVVGSGSGVIIKDSGVTVGTAATINFGDNLTVSPISAGIVTVTASGGGNVGSAGTWAVNAAGIHTTKNVGIGTELSSSALTVQGDGRFSGVVTATQFSAAGTGGTSVITSASDMKLLATGDISITPTGSLFLRNNLVLDTDLLLDGNIINTGVVTTSGLRVGTGGTVITTDSRGFVGIKSTSPTTTLDVGGSIQANGFILSKGSIVESNVGDGTDIGYLIAYNITSNGSTAYRFAGPGLVSTTDNPTLYLHRGFSYAFINSTGTNHPFEIRYTNGGVAYGSTYLQGTSTGSQVFTVPFDAPSSLVYQCTIHSGMVGTLNIVS